MRTVLDATGVTEARYGADPVTLPWAQIREARWQGGSLWPVFTDDGALVLSDGQGLEAKVPAWAGERASAAAVVKAHLPEGVEVR